MEEQHVASRKDLPWPAAAGVAHEVKNTPYRGDFKTTSNAAKQMPKATAAIHYRKRLLKQTFRASELVNTFEFFAHGAECAADVDVKQGGGRKHSLVAHR